jgi:acid phosphatase (class A)
MKRFHVMRCGLVLAAAAFAIAGGQAQENVMRPAATASPAVAPNFVAPAAFDFVALVPAPPAPGSLAAVAEIETILSVQAARTEADVAWAKLVEKDSVFNHAALFGAWFAKENLPALAVLFDKLGGDIRALDVASKKPFLRERPWKADARVEPCVQLPTSSSYPSGSAMQSYVWAAVLTDLWPEKRTELFARAQRAAWGRLIGGVHYPSDLTGGRMLAEAVVAELRKSAAFREELEKCRAELAAKRDGGRR